MLRLILVSTVFSSLTDVLLGLELLCNKPTSNCIHKSVSLHQPQYIFRPLSPALFPKSLGRTAEPDADTSTFVTHLSTFNHDPPIGSFSFTSIKPNSVCRQALVDCYFDNVYIVTCGDEHCNRQRSSGFLYRV
ncbi:hypothetical protein PISMIDRAFT_683162 [Pisolithus microcarpus 441]|uniref:Uncharacterized protein n=1 Tax=Pisolithus microcarpus 441 TaxID=765257 RepID=A0A0C9YZU5_9AGAM|nr:hypothetical protein BKA83DRAFT_683162 [Pisolithus microcarpus]KIK19484.1 hypothetical protein PISMIDRAFT_683162 [Pisolithus microcarpus 441]